jgi:Tol biopolymer transport system component
MKKTILLLMVLLTSFLVYINCEPMVAVASTPWTIKQMTKNDVEDTLGTWQSISGDGRRIVFDRRPPPIWGPGGYGVNWDVFTMNVTDEAGQEKQMTSAYGEDVGAGISFDGNTIAFASGRFHVGEPWDLEIFAMNFTDSPGQEVQISDNTAYLDSSVSISGDGKTVAWHTGPDTPLKHAEYITIANISDKSHIAYTIIDTPEWDMYPTLSSDGKKVCFTQFTDQINLGVFIANTDGTGITRIPGALGQGVISGDGSKVAVLYNDGDWEFSVIDVATGNTLFRTDNSVYDTFGSFDRDGNVIVYSRAGDIYICDLRTMQETQLTYDDCEDYSPRLDGDGDTIAFVSIGRDGPDSEIFVLRRNPIEAVIDIDPDSLNLRSKGNWITCFVELPGGYDVADIDVSTMMLNGTIPVDPSAPTAIGDYDNDGVPDLMVKFDRAAVQAYILANVNMTELIEEGFMTVTLTITGYLNDGPPFQGSNTVKIIMRASMCHGRAWPV